MRRIHSRRKWSSKDAAWAMVTRKQETNTVGLRQQERIVFPSYQRVKIDFAQQLLDDPTTFCPDSSKTDGDCRAEQFLCNELVDLIRLLTLIMADR
uniref:Uncharacterized protein n=1 Tax=Globodera rostochiensis TaxID=31243 RepID=A0A914IDS0_GLORO